jgi:hypothetical protein
LEEVVDAGCNTGPIPPRTLDQRVGLAIHWALSKHDDRENTDLQRAALKRPTQGLAETLQQELAQVGLKLI